MSEFVRTVSGKMEYQEVITTTDEEGPRQPRDYSAALASSLESDEVFGNGGGGVHHHHHHNNTTMPSVITAVNHNDPAVPSAGNVIDEIPPEEHEEDDDDEEGDDDVDDEEESLEDDYEYEDEDDAAVSGFLVDHLAAAAAAMIGATALSGERAAGGTAPTKIEEDDTNNNGNAGISAKPKWRQPTEAAVNMSLRAEKETSGGKRRLAQDLFRIMNQDTEEAGFSLRPSNEDSMDKWSIQLFQFDNESNLAKDMRVLGITNVELEMSFPDQYPFEPPFVRVLRPRFKRQTGFVMNGALCMELLTKDGWNPINDIESVIVSIRSLLVVGDGRLESAAKLSDAQYQKLLKEADLTAAADSAAAKRQKTDSPVRRHANAAGNNKSSSSADAAAAAGGCYSVTEAKAAYDHLSDYHKKKGWDTSGWWAKKG